MLQIIKKDYLLSVSIYEIPHGLLAFLIGKLRGIPTVISIIANTGYSKVRKDFRKKVTYYMYNKISNEDMLYLKSLIDNRHSIDRVADYIFI